MFNQRGSVALFILVGLVVVIGLVGGAYYWKKSQVSMPQAQNQAAAFLTSQPTPFSTPSLQPTSSVKISEGIKAIDGNIYKISSSGQRELLVKKGLYKPIISGGEVYFTEIDLSPDGAKILVTGSAGTSLSALYYTYLNKIDIKYIGSGQGAVWSYNSRYIAYINGPADALMNAWIHVYDTKLNKKIDIVYLQDKPNIKNLNYDYPTFDNLSWSEDDATIKVHAVAHSGSAPHGEVIGKGDISLPINAEK